MGKKSELVTALEQVERIQRDLQFLADKLLKIIIFLVIPFAIFALGTIAVMTWIARTLPQ